MSFYKFIIGVADVILDNDGLLFGGYPRDIVLHNYAARKFYKATQPGDCGELYGDCDYMPEAADRRLLPKDIDVMVNTSDIPKMESALKKQGYRVIRRINMPLGDYEMAAKGAQLTTIYVGIHTTPAMERLNKFFKHYSLKVDFVHCADIASMAMPLSDFDCNAFLMDKTRQLRLNPRLFEVHGIDDPLQRLNHMNKVVDRLLKKECIAVGNKVAPWRVTKMLEKGFKLYGIDQMFLLMPKPPPHTYSEMKTIEKPCCTICLDTLEGTTLKRNCCSAHYHTKCFKQLVESVSFTATCPQCRDIITTFELHRNNFMIQANIQEREDE